MRHDSKGYWNACIKLKFWVPVTDFNFTNTDISIIILSSRNECIFFKVKIFSHLVKVYLYWAGNNIRPPWWSLYWTTGWNILISNVCMMNMRFQLAGWTTWCHIGWGKIVSTGVIMQFHKLYGETMACGRASQIVCIRIQTFFATLDAC